MRGSLENRGRPAAWPAHPPGPHTREHTPLQFAGWWCLQLRCCCASVASSCPGPQLTPALPPAALFPRPQRGLLSTRRPAPQPVLADPAHLLAPGRGALPQAAARHQPAGGSPGAVNRLLPAPLHAHCHQRPHLCHQPAAVGKPGVALRANRCCCSGGGCCSRAASLPVHQLPVHQLPAAGVCSCRTSELCC